MAESGMEFHEWRQKNPDMLENLAKPMQEQRGGCFLMRLRATSTSSDLVYLYYRRLIQQSQKNGMDMGVCFSPKSLLISLKNTHPSVLAS